MITTSGRGNHREPDTAASEKITECVAELEKRDEKYRIGKQENDNIEHVF